MLLRSLDQTLSTLVVVYKLPKPRSVQTNQIIKADYAEETLRRALGSQLERSKTFHGWMYSVSSPSFPAETEKVLDDNDPIVPLLYPKNEALLGTSASITSQSVPNLQSQSSNRRVRPRVLDTIVAKQEVNFDVLVCFILTSLRDLDLWSFEYSNRAGLWGTTWG